MVVGRDLYAPSNATTESKLPVFFFIQGGGFNVNGNPNLNGTGLVTASGNNIIVVTINYRVGPYGFLTDGSEISPNNGLFDQRKALEWVQEYITQFGGVSIPKPLCSPVLHCRLCPFHCRSSEEAENLKTLQKASWNQGLTRKR